MVFMMRDKEHCRYEKLTSTKRWYYKIQGSDKLIGKLFVTGFAQNILGGLGLLLNRNLEAFMCMVLNLYPLTPVTIAGFKLIQPDDIAYIAACRDAISQTVGLPVVQDLHQLNTSWPLSQRFNIAKWAQWEFKIIKEEYQDGNRNAVAFAYGVTQRLSEQLS